MNTQLFDIKFRRFAPEGYNYQALKGGKAKIQFFGS